MRRFVVIAEYIVGRWWIQVPTWLLFLVIAGLPGIRNVAVFFLYASAVLLIGVICGAARIKMLGVYTLFITASPLLLPVMGWMSEFGWSVWEAHQAAPAEDRTYETALITVRTWLARLEGPEGRQMVLEWEDSYWVGIGRAVIFLITFGGGAFSARWIRNRLEKAQNAGAG